MKWPLSGPSVLTTLNRGLNITFGAEVAVLVAYSALKIAYFGPNAQVDFYIVYPYCHTVILWGVSYLLVKRFYPIKVLYFVFLWGFEELAWNTAYFLAKYPASLAWGSVMASPEWYRYMLILSLISGLGVLAIRKNLLVDFRWVVGFLMFESVYVVSGAPVVFGSFGQGYTPSNWIWETLYNVLAMMFYLGMFRERVLNPREEVLQTTKGLLVNQIMRAGRDHPETTGDGPCHNSPMIILARQVPFKSRRGYHEQQA
jgi:hypothetical protein